MNMNVHPYHCVDVFVFFQFRRFQTELEDEFGDDVKVVSMMSYSLPYKECVHTMCIREYPDTL